MSTLRHARPAALLALALASELTAQAPELAFRAEHRARFEHLAPDFRAGVGDVTALSLRTLVGLEWAPRSLFLTAEFADSRAYASDDAPLNTTHVNTLDVLSAHAGVRVHDVFASGDALTVRAGRLTKDMGSRRLVARSVFRNTINAFTGLDAAWTGASGFSFEAFALVPVTRRPGGATELAGNDVARDRENGDAVLWGVAAAGSAAGDVALHAYLLGYHERDGDVASANRRIATPGLRIVRSPRPGRLDFQLEAMGQLGTSRATSAASDVTDLRHRAFSGHASVGYRFAAAPGPRVALQYDVASGDADPADDTNGRFDPFFGARAFELGPTGFYGAFARSNLSSVALRVEVAPRASFDVVAAHRLAWVESARDAWTTTGARDPDGSSGTFLGQQVDVRVRVRSPVPGLAVELGGAALLPGEFAREVGAMDRATPYVYSQVTVTGGRS